MFFWRSPEHVCRSEQEVRPESSDGTTVGLPPRVSTPVFSRPSGFASFPTFLCLEPQTNLAGVRFKRAFGWKMAKERRGFKRTTTWTIAHVAPMPQGLFMWPKISDLRFLVMKSFSSLYAWRFDSNAVCVCVCVPLRLKINLQEYH